MRLAELAPAGGFVAREPCELGAFQANKWAEHFEFSFLDESGRFLKGCLNRSSGCEAFRAQEDSCQCELSEWLHSRGAPERSRYRLFGFEARDRVRRCMRMLRPDGAILADAASAEASA